jgi:hypothetical protein
MSKRRLAFALMLGLVLAIFVSACGVSVGPVQFTAGGPAVFSPTIIGLHLPGLTGTHAPAVMGSMSRLQTIQSVNQAQSLFDHAVGGRHGND